MKLRVSNECYNSDGLRVDGDSVVEFIRSSHNSCLSTSGPVATTGPALLPEYVRGFFEGKHKGARFPWLDTSTPPKEREVNFTASDIAPLIGVCPYNGCKDVYRKKLGLKKSTGGFAAERGLRLEGEALGVYSLVTGHSLVQEPLGYVRAAPSGAGLVLGATVSVIKTWVVFNCFFFFYFRLTA